MCRKFIFVFFIFGLFFSHISHASEVLQELQEKKVAERQLFSKALNPYFNLRPLNTEVSLIDTTLEEDEENVTLNALYEIRASRNTFYAEWSHTTASQNKHDLILAFNKINNRVLKSEGGLIYKSTFYLLKSRYNYKIDEMNGTLKLRDFSGDLWKIADVQLLHVEYQFFSGDFGNSQTLLSYYYAIMLDNGLTLNAKWNFSELGGFWSEPRARAIGDPYVDWFTSATALKFDGDQIQLIRGGAEANLYP